MLFWWQQCPLVYSKLLSFLDFVFLFLFRKFRAIFVSCFPLCVRVFLSFFNLSKIFDCVFVFAVLFDFWSKSLQRHTIISYVSICFYCIPFYYNSVIFHQSALGKTIVCVVLCCFFFYFRVLHVDEDKLSVYYKLWYFMWTRA